jgi:DNA ligase-1
MKLLIVVLLITFALSTQSQPQLKPAIQQGTVYKPVDDINKYWVSEKLDGMRGYWNGSQLYTRQGNLINSPPWFTKNWPNSVIDGELWIKRGYFQQTLSCIRKKKPDDICWQPVRFMIFDLPEHTGTFTQRVNSMQKIVNDLHSPYLSLITQFKLSTIEQLTQTLDKVSKNDGEGLMLHRANAYYHVGRTDNIMKLKKHDDAEARVIAYIEGKGKYKGVLGAIKVETIEGIVFKIGSGFTDKERHNPPPIGSLITFKYNGKTQAGIPRFARYFRVRENNTVSVKKKRLTRSQD